MRVRTASVSSCPDLPDIQRIILLREGRIVADGPKEEILTEENLEKTYAAGVRVAKVDGYYLAYPPNSD